MKRGFSLLEAMIAMGLAFLVLGLLAVLMREYTGVNRLTSSKQATLDGVQFALREMRNELSCALHVEKPGTGGPSTTNVLEFRRLNPQIGTDRLPDPNSFPPYPLSWSHADPTHLLDVTYEINSEKQLVRSVTAGLPARSDQVVAEEIASLTVTRTSKRRYDITVGFQELNRLKTYSLICKRWVSPKALTP